VSFWLSVIAGIGAGAAAGAVNIGLLALMHARLPPVEATGVSSLVAGGLAGIMYWAWTRLSTRPVAALWITSLVIATVDTAVVFALPFPTAARHIRVPGLAGLVTPVLQMLALVGIGGSAPAHLPSAARPAYVVVHYVTAAIASWFIPLIVRPRTR
jgi:hypothetical protein